ncbi:hypothetical protein GUJ93_ZPchr0007g5999 [Zizania palustris]|uniref:Homeobox domain-containing protein n=1 Tax=Zizania palustris TaxID=103762 RepID=A0A8J5THH8_ZIZPA|nr:hypothetical protein GUJ93_ZPchr0007g5999 [Zizania palustris]
MFRSKHAAQPWQTTQPDMGGSPHSLLSAGSSGCALKSPFSSGGEERVQDPKPRWNPRPEQIRILEAIFNSGMVNPPRDEIPRIRMQLQEYGQVGDANVFYWFQNRKSRSKNKLRAASGRGTLGARGCAPAAAAATPAREAALEPFTLPPIPPQPLQPHQQLLVASVAAPTSSSSSSSDRSSGSSKPLRPTAQAMPATGTMDTLSPLAAVCNQQMLYQGQPLESSTPSPKLHTTMALDEPFLFQWPQGPCLSAVNLGAAIFDGQYMHLPVPVNQPPSSPVAGMIWGLGNDDVSEPNNNGHRSCAWSAGLGQQWLSGAADQLGPDKSSLASIAGAVSKQDTHVDTTKLGLLQYGFGISTPAVHVDVTCAAAAGTLPLVVSSSPDAAVTVAATAWLTDFTASTIPTGAVADNPLQGLADFGVAAAAAAPTSTAPSAAGGRGGVVAGTAVVCVGIGGTTASFVFPAARFNMRHYFGEAAVLLRCSGESTTEPVRVDASGVTVEPLQQGAVYLVVM